jgi:hypothetical protein
MVTFLGVSRLLSSATWGDGPVLFPDHRTGGKSMSRPCTMTTSAQGTLAQRRKSANLDGVRRPKPMASRPSMLASRSPIVSNGALASKLALSKSFSKSIEVTKDQHATFVGEASLSGMLKDTIEVRKTSFGVGGKMKKGMC